MKVAGELVGLLTGVLALMGAALLAAEYLFNFTVFDPSKEYAASYNSTVVPVIQIGDQFIAENISEIEKNDRGSFERLAREFVIEKGLQGRLISAVDSVELIIKCQQNWFCRIENYETYQRPIRELWYTYRPALTDIRGNIRPLDFGVILEEEANRVLADDRAAGLTPKS